MTVPTLGPGATSARWVAAALFAAVLVGARAADAQREAPVAASSPRNATQPAIYFYTEDRAPLTVGVSGYERCLLPCSLPLPAGLYSLDLVSNARVRRSVAVAVGPSRNEVLARITDPVRRRSGIALLTLSAVHGVAGLALAFTSLGSDATTIFDIVGIPLLVVGMALSVAGATLVAMPSASASARPWPVARRPTWIPTIGWQRDELHGGALPAMAVRF